MAQTGRVRSFGLAARLAAAPGNRFGALGGLCGIVGAEVVAAVALGVLAAAVGVHKNPSELAKDAVGLIGLWIGFVGTVVVTSASRSDGSRTLRRSLVEDYGVAIRPIDVVIGLVVGLAGQYLLVPLLELPLLPFVPHLFQRLGQPARSLTAGESGAKLAVLGVLVCLGSPLVEELFFRGLFFRGLVGLARSRFQMHGAGGVVLAAVISGAVFGLVHFEALQLIALAGFGVVLALLAALTGRLGAGIVAHIVFNTVTFVALATSH